MQSPTGLVIPTASSAMRSARRQLRFGFQVLLATALAVTVLMTGSKAHAAGICYSKVQSVHISHDGSVWISAGTLLNSSVCSLSGTVGSANPITKEACHGMLSVFQAAQLSGREVMIYFGSQSTCPSTNWVSLTSPTYNFYHVTMN